MARWLKTYPHDDVYFHYHGAPKRDTGWDVDALAAYWAREYELDLSERLILTSRNLTPSNTLPKDKLKYVYGAADVYFHVCAAEGWGLTVAEAMACGIPTVVPDYSALAEWPREAVTYVAVDPHPWANPSDVDTIHRFVDVDEAVEVLEMMYRDTAYRERMGQVAAAHMKQAMFSWDHIAEQFEAVFSQPRITKKARGRYVASHG